MIKHSTSAIPGVTSGTTVDLMETPSSIQKLGKVLVTCKSSPSPGPDVMRYTSLRNIGGKAKLILPHNYNLSWESVFKTDGKWLTESGAEFREFIHFFVQAHSFFL